MWGLKPIGNDSSEGTIMDTAPDTYPVGIHHRWKDDFFSCSPHKRIFSLLHMWREDGSLPWGMLLLATTSFLKAPFEKEEIVGGGSSWKGIFQILICVRFFSGDTQYDGNNWCGCLKWWKNCRKWQRVWQQENRLILHLLYNIYHQPVLYILLSFV